MKENIKDFFYATWFIWLIAAIVLAIGVSVAAVGSINSGIPHQIELYRSYYSECMAIADDAELCGNLAGAKAVR